VNTLIVTHHPEEGPGLLEPILRERGWGVDEVGVWKDNGLPDPAPFHLLILMGGPMSVNDDDLYPFLVEEKTFVCRWIEEGKPVVGICLGAQLIAHCLGGRVYKGPHEEIGWYKVSLTEQGKRDPCLGAFPVFFPVFQWHGETFDLPDNIVLLVTSQEYPHQAFRYKDSIYAFQFHLEVTDNMVRSWLSGSDVDEAQQRSIISSLHLHLPAIHQLCRDFMGPFLDTIERFADTRRVQSYANAKINSKPTMG
jgi:GMP synthase (glutamine-hydrolysing)